MAIIAIDKSLDVINKYTRLINESLDTNSVYIRTKETLEALVTRGDLSGADKAKVVAEVLNNLNNSLVNASMSTALAWAKAEKDAEFQKEELGYKVDVIEQQALTEAAKIKQLMADVMATTATSMRQNGAAAIDPSTGFTIGLANEGKGWEEIQAIKSQVDLTGTQVNKVKADILAVTASSLRNNGRPDVIHPETGFVDTLSQHGKVWNEMELMKQELINKRAEEHVILNKLKESQAAVYKIVADSVANFGKGTYTLTDAGITEATFSGADSLSHYQKQIAEQQAKGYAYNAWANAVNASSTAVSMLLSTESSSSTIENAAGSLSGYLVSGVEKLITQAVLPE